VAEEAEADDLEAEKARLAHPPELTRLTRTGGMPGTLPYLSPSW